MPMTMFGLVGRLARGRGMRSRHRHFSAMPPSIAASLEPVVDVPVASSSSGEFHSRLSMFTQRISRSAVRGYSSLSIMFLSNVSRHERFGLRLHPRRDERREVQPRVAVEHELVVHDLVRGVGLQARRRQLLAWCGVHLARTGEHRGECVAQGRVGFADA